MQQAGGCIKGLQQQAASASVALDGTFHKASGVHISDEIGAAKATRVTRSLSQTTAATRCDSSSARSWSGSTAKGSSICMPMSSMPRTRKAVRPVDSASVQFDECSGAVASGRQANQATSARDAWRE